MTHPRQTLKEQVENWKIRNGFEDKEIKIIYSQKWQRLTIKHSSFTLESETKTAGDTMILYPFLLSGYIKEDFLIFQHYALQFWAETAKKQGIHKITAGSPVHVDNNIGSYDVYWERKGIDFLIGSGFEVIPEQQKLYETYSEERKRLHFSEEVLQFDIEWLRDTEEYLEKINEELENFKEQHPSVFPHGFTHRNDSLISIEFNGKKINFYNKRGSLYLNEQEVTLDTVKEAVKKEMDFAMESTRIKYILNPPTLQIERVLSQKTLTKEHLKMIMEVLMAKDLDPLFIEEMFAKSNYSIHRLGHSGESVLLQIDGCYLAVCIWGKATEFEVFEKKEEAKEMIRRFYVQQIEKSLKNI